MMMRFFSVPFSCGVMMPSSHMSDTDRSRPEMDEPRGRPCMAARAGQRYYMLGVNLCVLVVQLTETASQCPVRARCHVNAERGAPPTWASHMPFDDGLPACESTETLGPSQLARCCR